MEGAPGLRERQRQRRRKAMLAAGRELFVRQGYAATSMEAIADQAEVGVATVYNYFGSKGQLLAEILQAEFDALFQRGDRLLAKPPPDPAAGVLALIDVYRRFQESWRNRGLLVAIIGPGLSAEPVLDELATEVEARVKQQLQELLAAYQRQGLIRPSIETGDAAMIIFYVFNQHFIEYVTHADADEALMKGEMERQLRFLVSAIREA